MDASSFWQEYTSTDSLKDRRMGASPEDSRSVVDILIDQVGGDDRHMTTDIIPLSHMGTPAGQEAGPCLLYGSATLPCEQPGKV